MSDLKNTIIQLRGGNITTSEFIRWYEDICEVDNGAIYADVIKELGKHLENMNCIMGLASVKINTDKIDEKVQELVNGKIDPHQFRYWYEYSSKTYWYMKHKLAQYGKNANCLTCLAYLSMLKEDPTKTLGNKEVLNLFAKAIALGSIAAISLYCEYRLHLNGRVFETETRSLCTDAYEKGDQLAPYLLGVYKTINDEHLIQEAITRGEPLAMVYVANRYVQQKEIEEKAIRFYLQAYTNGYKFEDLPQLRLLLSEMCKIVKGAGYNNFLVQTIKYVLHGTQKQ